jgi:sortase (surface protein transpeptidase)
VGVLAALGLLVALAGCGSPAEPAPAAAPSPAAPTPTATATATATTKADGSWGPVTGQSPVAAPTGRAAAGVVPTGVAIPAIGVRATSLIPLELMGNGELEAPEDFGDTGWYAAGTVPGEPGPAVIAAHVDSRDGPAVFFRLRELKAGDEVRVPRSDGSTVSFTVTGVERYPKNAFPTQKVHGPTPDRALRLITCGGSFDHAKRSYRDNVVVYAVAT